MLFSIQKLGFPTIQEDFIFQLNFCYHFTYLMIGTLKENNNLQYFVIMGISGSIILGLIEKRWMLGHILGRG